VDLYAATLGAVVAPVILVAVFTTMFSTTLTVMDGFPRAIARSFRVLSAGIEEGAGGGEENTGGYWISLVVLAALTVLVFRYFVGNLTSMVDFATIVSFITAPVLGYLNLRAVTAPHVPEEERPRGEGAAGPPARRTVTRRSLGPAANAWRTRPMAERSRR
jgi:hypothetical protein